MADIDAHFAPALRLLTRPIDELPTGFPPGGEPKYDHLYVVRIEDCNPKRLDVKLKRVSPPAQQSMLNQAYLNAAERAPDWPNLSSVGGKLDLLLSSKTGALVIFHLVDTAATFIAKDADSAAHSILTTDPTDPHILYRPTWVEGIAGARTAVSVILWRDPSLLPVGTMEEHDYAVGIKVRDERTSVLTPIFIDPKIQNDGGG